MKKMLESEKNNWTLCRDDFWVEDLKKGLHIIVQTVFDGYCGDGGELEYKIIDDDDNILKEGTTCHCGRGCGAITHDCICDTWCYHDTDIEEFREEV